LQSRKFWFIIIQKFPKALQTFIMKISGFTIIKNAIINDYPILEAIGSILPVVDEMVVLVGDSSDDTEQLIRSIVSDKIKIHHSVWNPNLRNGGEALADETNKAFALIDPEATWAFYIQADEIVHEKYHGAILDACKKHKDDTQVQGLLFNYLHFFGSYDYVGDSRKWYNKEVRIIKNDKSISAYRDAQGFRVRQTKLRVKKANASIYHYGWVKEPSKMKMKQKEVVKYWHEDESLKEVLNTLKSEGTFDYNAFDSLAKFTDSHPKVMEKRIAEKNWSLELDISKKKFSFKNRLLYFFEKATGIRLFSFKNYKLLP